MSTVISANYECLRFFFAVELKVQSLRSTGNCRESTVVNSPPNQCWNPVIMQRTGRVILVFFRDARAAKEPSSNLYSSLKAKQPSE